MAVSYLEARRLVKEDDYYIVYQEKGFFDEGYTTYCYDGKNKKPVILTGENPFYMHADNGNASIFCGAAKNKFLIKGQEVKKYQNIIEEMVIHVEKWEIIAPVKRVYANEYDHRYLYPLNCIDEYDVERGDYIPDTVGDQTLYSWEVDYYLENEKDYFLIACQREKDKMHFYLCSDGMPDQDEKLTDKIELSGNYPDNECYDKIFVDKDSDSRNHYNYILVKGTLEQNTIQVEDWKLAYTVWRDKNENNSTHSSYYLDERDE